MAARPFIAAAALAALAVGCGTSPDAPSGEDAAHRADAFSVEARSNVIKAAAAARGVTNGLLVAGIAMHESKLAQCWSEAEWGCGGPYSTECGGPVLAGSGDGACSAHQGGIGMFQFDGGTWSQTLGTYGDAILSVAGNAAAGADFILSRVASCPNMPELASVADAAAWMNGALPGTADFETFLTAAAWCYNGCAPSYKGCDHADVRERYRSGIQELLDQLGWAYWYGGGGGGGSTGDCGTQFTTAGAVRQKWLSLGACDSFLGAPATSDRGASDGIGRFSYFDEAQPFDGAIYWSPTTGAHEIHGQILRHWALGGWETGPFGYPVSDQYTYDGSKYGIPGQVAANEFQKGWIGYAFATGQIYEWLK